MCVWMCVCVCVCECVRACVCVCAGDSVSARVLCFSVCQFHFALYDWVVMHYYLLIFVYLCNPCCGLIKWESVLSRRTRTINSMCMGECTETCEHVCVRVWVRLHIHPNLHTYSIRVCVCACVHACVRACRRVCECEGVVFQCVSVMIKYK